MFNLADYTKQLEIAESVAAHFCQARVVRYWRSLNEFSELSLSLHTELESDGSDAVIAASVDHHGIITESKWVKEQIEKLGEVAA
jgi:hypothetical protein